MHTENSSLYCDNYRGFKDTLVNFCGVNFLVGENSTGKTSLLSLVALTESNDFWAQNSFNSSPVNLGYFSELTSSPNDTITVGCTRRAFSPPDNNEVGFIRVRFKNVDNIPTLHEVSIIVGHQEIACVIEKSIAHYSINTFTDPIKTEDFPAWVRKSSTPKPDKNFKIPDGTPFGISMIIQIAAYDAGTDQKKSILPYIYQFFYFPPAVWVAPIRAKPKRTYDNYSSTRSPEGDHVPYVINELLSSRSDKFIEEVRSFGKQSGLFNTIATKRYGKGKTAPFEVSIKMGRHNHKISNVGYGVSQVLPVLIETLDPSPRSSRYLVQQPEVHLHPRAQAALGNLFYSLSTSGEKEFFIETHSDFLIDRYRLLISRNKPPATSAQVLFFQHEKGCNCVTALAIDKYGRYTNDQPDKFRDFFLKEQLDILTI